MGLKNSLKTDGGQREQTMHLYYNWRNSLLTSLNFSDLTLLNSLVKLQVHLRLWALEGTRRHLAKLLRQLHFLSQWPERLWLPSAWAMLQLCLWQSIQVVLQTGRAVLQGSLLHPAQLQVWSLFRMKTHGSANYCFASLKSMLISR